MSKTLDELNKFNERCKQKYIKKVERYENIKKNYISKQKVKDKIEELKKEYEIALEENSTKAFILKCKISALEELLEENNK